MEYDVTNLFIDDEAIALSEGDMANEICEIVMEIDNFRKD